MSKITTKISWSVILKYSCFLIPASFLLAHSHWQLLDDQLVVSNPYFPPWETSALISLKDGRNYIGFGFLWELQNILFSRNSIGYYFLNLVLWASIIGLSYKLITRISSNFTGKIAALFIFTLPSGIEQNLTLFKLEKWSAFLLLGFMLLVIDEKGRINNYKGSFHKLLFFTVGLSIIFFTKETVIFFILVFYIFYLDEIIKNIKNKLHPSRHILVGSLVLLMFKYLPHIIFSSNTNYTSGLGLNFARANNHFTGYLFREPSIFFLAVTGIILTLYYLVFIGFPPKPILMMQIYSLVNIIFLIYFWDQAQIYYLYDAELFSVISIFTIIYKIHTNAPTAKKLKILVPRLSVIILAYVLILNLIMFSSRYVANIAAHDLDHKAISISQDMRGIEYIWFPEDSEMFGNFNFFSHNSLKPISSIRCNTSILVPYGKPENIALGFRGVNWPSKQNQNEQIRQFVPNDSKIRIIEDISFNSKLPIIGMAIPSIKSIFVPELYEFEYGYQVLRIECNV